MKESYSDFSIIKSYLELRQKYDTEVKQFRESSKGNDEKLRQHIATLEQEVAKRNEYIKAQEKKLQEATRKLAEKDEQLKQMGLQLHKVKMQTQGSPQAASAEAPDSEEKRRRGFFK